MIPRVTWGFILPALHFYGQVTKSPIVFTFLPPIGNTCAIGKNVLNKLLQPLLCLFAKEKQEKQDKGNPSSARPQTEPGEILLIRTRNL